MKDGGCLEVTVCEGEDLSHLRWYINRVKLCDGQVTFFYNMAEVYVHATKKWLDLGISGQLPVFRRNLAEFYTGPFAIEAGVVVWTELKKGKLVFNKLFFRHSSPLPNEPAILEEIMAVEMVYFVG